MSIPKPRSSSLITLGLAVVGVLIVISLVGPLNILHSGEAARPWRYIFNLAAFIVFVSCIIAIIPVVRQGVDTSSEYVCGLVASAALIPTTIAEVSTVAAYVAPVQDIGGNFQWVHELALLIGTTAGLTAWALWSWYYKYLATPERQNASAFANLRENYEELVATFCALKTDKDAALDRITLARIEHHLPLLGETLGNVGKNRPSLRWVLGTGYISLWMHVHAVEEAMIRVAPERELVFHAVHDMQRLRESRIPNGAQLQSALYTALCRLSPASKEYVDQMLNASSVFRHSTPDKDAATTGKTQLQNALHTALGRRKPAFKDHDDQKPTTAETRMEAREVLSHIRNMINSFRDGRWERLVRQRNRLTEAVIFTRMTSYALLGLAILLRVDAALLLGAAVFYFVGALVGLFNRLQAIGGAEQEFEDYGLASATLVQTTPFSGLAAVGGVMLTGLLVVSVDQAAAVNFASTIAGTALPATATVTRAVSTVAATVTAPPAAIPTATPAVIPTATPAAAVASAPVALNTIFDLTKNQLGLVVAAIFGLTPSLLLNRLQRAAQQQTLDLRSTTTGETTHASAQTSLLG